MAHFAELDEDNIVKRVVVINNSDLVDNNGNESEQKGRTLCSTLYGGRWVQTSFNNRVRRRYANIGDFYDPELDAFITPKPYPSWTLDRGTCDWKAPVPKPANPNKFYEWDEAGQVWYEVE